MKHYHAHIYFNSEDINLARSLTARAKQINFFEYVGLYDGPIGPHPKAMIELQFREIFYSATIEWIEANRENLSVLVHQDTGDDIKDHTQNILWLGQQVPLDFSFFELIKTHPHLRLHPT